MPNRRRVLHIDDDPMVRRLVVRLLRDYTIVGAPDGGSGLARWEEEGPFDLVVCDMVMPDMSGEQVHGRLGILSVAAAARMLFLTSGALTLGGQEFLARMGERVLWKPVDPEAFRAKVRAALLGTP